MSINTNELTEKTENILPKEIMDAIECYATVISYEGNDYSTAVLERINAHDKLCELLSIDKEEFKPFEYNTSVINGKMKYKTAVNILISSIKYLKTKED
jgi:hypothetical protein